MQILQPVAIAGIHELLQSDTAGSRGAVFHALALAGFLGRYALSLGNHPDGIRGRSADFRAGGRRTPSRWPIKKLAEFFADERAKLEQEWSTGNDVSTENLRQALRRYRAFFHRLLAI